LFDTADRYDGMILGLKAVRKTCAEIVTTYQTVMKSLDREPRYDIFCKALLNHFDVDEVKVCFHDCPVLSDTKINDIAKK